METPLPRVACQVRARIPTSIGGADMFLHVYENSMDTKEHLAIVFGQSIRSETLNAPRPGETERDRLIRGAFSGKLYPGRTSSKEMRMEADQAAILNPLAQPTDQTNGHAQQDKSTEANGSTANTNGDSQKAQDPVLVRLHSECFSGETAWSTRCDCGEQLDEAARLMSEQGDGVIIYLRQEGRGIGLADKMRAYNLIDSGEDTYTANLLLNHGADERTYEVATAMLMDLGLGGERGIRLLTNNPDKVKAVEGPNQEVRVAERIPMVPLSWQTGGKEGIRGVELDAYLSTKVRTGCWRECDFGHVLIYFVPDYQVQA